MCAVLGCTRRRHQGVTFGERCVDLLQLASANLNAERISYFRAAVKPFAKKFPGAFVEKRIGSVCGRTAVSVVLLNRRIALVPAGMSDKTVDKWLKPPYNLEKVELS